MPIVSRAELTHYGAVYLSPHLDDVILSCAGALAADRRQGRRSLVATLFTEGDASYAARRQEDAGALELLGADGIWAGLTDAPFRSARYRSFAGIVLDRDPADITVEATAAQWLGEVLARAQPERLIAPLGVGGHVDHRLAHRVAVQARAQVLRFYEDRPYALVRGMVERRLRTLGQDSPRAGLRERLRFATDFARAGYVHTWLRPLDAVRAPRIRWGSRQVRLRRHRARWKWELVVEGPETLALSSQALACYGTQWPTLFGSLADYERQTRRYGGRIGPASGRVERLWRSGDPR